MPLRIHVSNRLEVVVEKLAAELEADPLGPLEREVVVVGSRGMYRWLTLELARKLGISATIATPFPGTFFRALAERVEGRVAAPSERFEPVERSPYDRNALAWRIFALLGGDHVDVIGPAAAYLRGDADQRRRYQLATRLADRFDEYQLYRPDLVLAWEAGRQPISEPAVLEVARWQAALWRAVVASASEPQPGAGPERRASAARASETAPRAQEASAARSPARRFVTLVERLESGPGGDLSRVLPRRVQVFGAAALPPLFLRMLAALARHAHVALYALEPTRELWSEIRPARAVERQLDFFRERGLAAADAHVEVGNPLLAALGRQGQEMHRLLQKVDADGSARDELAFVVPARKTALAVLQADVAELVDRGSATRYGDGRRAPLPLRDGDDSLQVHVCHSPLREMEVLRDLVLDAFARDRSLRPHDVFVLMPDVATYAPYIDAVFGAAAADEPVLPFTIADRSARHEQPVVQAALRILDLVGGRATATAILELLDAGAVCRAARILDRDVATLRAWVREANVRWGIDGEHRRVDLGLPCDDVDTWRAGLDRLLMGYAVAAPGVAFRKPAADGGPFEHLVVPQPVAAAADADLLGRFAAWADGLLERLRALRAPRTLDAWAEDLRATLDALLDPADEVEELALQRLRDHVAALAEAPSRSGIRARVELEAVRTHLRDVLAAESGGAGFLGGAVTFCTLKPMRAIPAKLVCIAGLEDGAFPRSDRRPRFDLMAVERRDGDPSARDEDRYLFLETLLAARERLVLTYVGRSHTDNTERAPSSVVAELLEHVDRTFAQEAADAEPRRPSQRITVHHPLQPFSRRYFGGEAGLFSYSRENRRAAAAAADATARGRSDEAFCRAPLAAPEGRLEISLADLVEFWVNPSKHFCRNVLGLRLPGDERDAEETERFSLDPLDRYGLLEHLLARRLDGAPAGDEELAVLRAAGRLPHAGFGRAHYEVVGETVATLHAAVTAAAGGALHGLRTVAIDVEDGDWRVMGLVDQVAEECLLRFRAGNLNAKDRLRAWIAHVALGAWAASRPSDGAPLPRETVLVGRDASLRLCPLDDPAGVLAALVAGYREGCRRPLPVFTEASRAYAEQARTSASGRGGTRADPLAKAREKLEGRRGAAGNVRGDRDDRYVALCFRGVDPLERDRAEFERLATELWWPLLDATQEIER